MGSLKMKVIEIEKEEITRALRESKWIMARAARMLDITERMIGYKIRKYGIQREEGARKQGSSAAGLFDKRVGLSPEKNKGGLLK